MKKGDYSVHILIEEIKNCIQLSDSKQPFPIVKVSCFDKSKRTAKTEIGCTDYVFGEHFYFDKTNLTTEMLDSEKIIIEVYDANQSGEQPDQGYDYNSTEVTFTIDNLVVKVNNSQTFNVSGLKFITHLAFNDFSGFSTLPTSVDLESSNIDF